MSYELRETLVSLQDVCLSFEGKPVLNKVCAEVKDIVRTGFITGQVVGILGPSGVGKTQLSRIMTGLQEPTGGKICIGGQSTPIEAGTVGYVMQNYPLLRHRTVLGNLMVAARRSGLNAKAAEEKSMDYLNRFELADKWDVYPSQLSGGQRQRIAILQQLLCSEHYLVLDEPTTGLDPIMKDKVCNLIRQVAEMAEENTIFIVSHDISSIMTVADRLWLIGRNRDEQGNSLGANIRYQYDLAERGIAWTPNPSALPAFQSLVHEIRDRFETL